MGHTCCSCEEDCDCTSYYAEECNGCRECRERDDPRDRWNEDDRIDDDRLAFDDETFYGEDVDLDFWDDEGGK